MDSLLLIESVIRRAAEENNAVRAILFGSYARGTSTLHSDVDVVFVERTHERFLQRIDKYLGYLTDNLHSAIDVLVYTPEEFASMQDTPFMRRILAEGIIVYEQ